MTASNKDKSEKWVARTTARQRRKMVTDKTAGRLLVTNFPSALSHSCVAGFAPIGDEIDLWPLLHHLRDLGRIIGLPVTKAKPAPLIFRDWTKNCEMGCDKYGIQYPLNGVAIDPTLILVPLLAFTSRGERLGYGGGYYDRTLSKLRSAGEVFACGVSYAGQEVDSLPTDAHDQHLDGILTEHGFRTFK